MESLIFALVSLIFLVPILIILPLGLKANGKFTVIVASLLIAIIGILAKNAFSLWQSSLMVVLLAFVAAYILDKRLGNAIFIHITPKKKVAMEEKEAIIKSRSELEEAEQVLPDILPNLMEVNQNKMETTEKEEPYVKENEFVNDASISEEKVKTSKSEDYPMDEEIEEDISFLMNRDTLEEGLIETTADASIHSLETNYMEEIERILETESDVDGWIEGKKERQQESKLEIENKAEDFTTALEDSDQFDVKSESIPLLEDDVELEEIYSEDFIKEARNQDKISSSNVMETTIASTWEEDEIQPLHFDDVTNQLHTTQQIDGTKKIKVEK